MTISCSGVFGGRSSSQSKCGSMTTDLGIAIAESSSSISRSASSPAPGVGTYGSTFTRFQRTLPSIDFAYGSISSLLGLKRCPLAGS